MQLSNPEEHRLQVNGVELAFFEWRRALRGGDAPILLAPATGFHTRVWDQSIGGLCGANTMLGLSTTVDVHRARIMEELGAQSLPDLFRRVVLTRGEKV